MRPIAFVTTSTSPGCKMRWACAGSRVILPIPVTEYTGASTAAEICVCPPITADPLSCFEALPCDDTQASAASRIRHRSAFSCCSSYPAGSTADTRKPSGFAPPAAKLLAAARISMPGSSTKPGTSFTTEYTGRRPSCHGSCAQSAPDRYRTRAGSPNSGRSTDRFKDGSEIFPICIQPPPFCYDVLPKFFCI